MVFLAQSASAIDVIKYGIKKDSIYTADCDVCGSQLSAYKPELRFVDKRFESRGYYGICPVCSNSFVHFKCKKNKPKKNNTRY